MDDRPVDALSAEQWRRYLTLVDRELTEPRAIVIIGGGALALKHDPRYATRDLDAVTSMSGELAGAAEKAGRQVQAEYQLRHPPPVSSCPVWSGPYNYEDRLERVEFGELQKLRVFVPEVHDLALMKASRYSEKDVRALVSLHRQNPFDLPTLVERYGEMEYIGSREHFRTSMCLLTGELYGENTERALRPRLELLDATVGRTPEECRALAHVAMWEGALADELVSVKKRAANLQNELAKEIVLTRARRDEAPAGRERAQHEARLSQLARRESFARELAHNPVRAGQLARARALDRYRDVAPEAELGAHVERSLQQRQREMHVQKDRTRERDP